MTKEQYLQIMADDGFSPEFAERRWEQVREDIVKIGPQGVRAVNEVFKMLVGRAA